MSVIAVPRIFTNTYIYIYCYFNFSPQKLELISCQIRKTESSSAFFIFSDFRLFQFQFYFQVERIISAANCNSNLINNFIYQNKVVL